MFKIVGIGFFIIASSVLTSICVSQIDNVITLDNNPNSYDISKLRDLNIVNYSPRSNSLWTKVQTPSTYYVSDVFFIDSLLGWASHSGVGIGIYKTTNSGYSWDSIQFSSLGDFLSGIIFVDRSTGWTCGSTGTIRKSTNGGNNWFSQDHFAANYYTVFFENSNTGFIGGYNVNNQALIIKTTNSGNNWQRILEDTLNQHTEVHCQYWIDANTGWFGGRRFFVKTTDGGNSFTNISPDFSNNYFLFSIFFLNENTGWVTGNDGTGRNIYKTTNGGLNWLYQFNPVSQYSFPQVNDIKFISNDTGWAAGFLGFILKKTNGGSNWNIEVDTNVFFGSLHTYEKSKAWCGAGNGQIWYLNIDKTTGIINYSSNIKDFELYQNYPNPFNPVTVIKYQLSRAENVSLKVYSALGKEVSTLVYKEQKEGFYQIKFDGSNLPSGIYFYVLKTDRSSESKKMTLIK